MRSTGRAKKLRTGLLCDGADASRHAIGLSNDEGSHV